MGTLEAALARVQDVTIGGTASQYGVPGMKWGVRKRRGSSGPSKITVTSKPGKGVVKVEGGHGRLPSADAKKKIAIKQKAKKSTLDSLSNEELNALVKRMNLEAQYRKLNPPKKNPARKFAEDMLKDIGQKELQKLARGDLSTIDSIGSLLGKGTGKHRKK